MVSAGAACSRSPRPRPRTALGTRSCGAARSWGVPAAAVELDRPATRGRCASPRFRGAALYGGCGSVHPGRLATGLRARLATSGVDVREDSAVRRVDATSAGVVVATAGRAGPRRRRCARRRRGGDPGAATAKQAHGDLQPRRRHRAGARRDRGARLDRGEAIFDSRHLVHYFRTTRDDRIAFGWGGGRVVPGTRLGGRAEVDPEVTAEVIRSLCWFFPQLEGRRIDHAWGGPIDVSPSHLPMVGSLDPRPRALRVRVHRQRRRPEPASSAASSPRWRSAAATNRRGWRSSRHRRGVCRRSRCATSAERSCVAR